MYSWEGWKPDPLIHRTSGRSSLNFLYSISLPCFSFSLRSILFLFFIFWLHPWHAEVPDQGLNLSHSCGNVGSLTYCIRQGLNPHLYSDLSYCSWILNPRHNSGNAPKIFFSISLSLYISFSFFFFLLFRAALVAYGSSQARGHIRAAAASPATATAMGDLNHMCDLCHSSQFNPLRDARDGTRILMHTSLVCYCWTRWELLSFFFT